MSTQHQQRLHLLFLTAVCGMGGLLYGIDIGIIDPALPYLHRATSLPEGQLSLVVAAVMGGSILGSVVAGMLADWLGRRPMMVVSALLFVGSVSLIYLSQSFVPLLLGRLLQGLSGGVIAVVVPLYLAECLPASQRGRGLALFQFALTAGIVLAAFIGNHYLGRAELAIQAAGSDAAAVALAADRAWRSMFLAVLYPGSVFLLGCLFVRESPRWLMLRGRTDDAARVLARLRPAAQCEAELAEIGAALAQEKARPKVGRAAALAEMFTERRYVLPFVLACVILGCNQATGINSILQFMSTILQHAGLDPVSAASYGTAIKILNMVMTVFAIMLVERKGRVFLLKIGTAGIMVSLLLLALLFYRFESQRVDVRAEVAAQVRDNALDLNLPDTRFARSGSGPVLLSVLYQYGDKQQVAEAYTATAGAQAVPNGRIVVKPPAGAGAERLEIVRTSVGPIPDKNSGLLAALCIAGFIAAFSVGPGVCVWLALSELMPTRIRSVGMGVALLINQGTGTLIAGAFLPIVGNFGFHMMFLFWAGCTALYFITAAFFLPETRGKSLEEIERLFARPSAAN
ncbi:sugar porter family MFS transporter [Massilia sp. IC2-477]|uniref:MFS transporter n=1 Tax=Massilia sp. IC2-477 TaxID=2887198 RepID=UPI001D108C34|nr:MFS transporter [Massilia sp. IC2-477]MCC2957408.1 sugar porter family MFS transporter [Massilia sp. IC2-477]